MVNIYYRYVYSPSTGDVTLSHNHEGRPADIRFHSDMAEERSERDLTSGYAFKLDNGWKVTDREFKPSQDPHQIVAVENAIKDYERSVQSNH
jgi:hypothetical protein